MMVVNVNLRMAGFFRFITSRTLRFARHPHVLQSGCTCNRFNARHGHDLAVGCAVSGFDGHVARISRW
jgi:hypothetical protein